MLFSSAWPCNPKKVWRLQRFYEESFLQIALTLRDEVLDLERAGIRIIQIDEAAMREGLPLRRGDWKSYFDWAVGAFRITASGVADEAQIHTQMTSSNL